MRVRTPRLLVISTLMLFMAILGCGDAFADCSGGRKVDVGGYGLWMRSQGEGAPTIVFESGGGDDSSVWSNIEPLIRERAEVRTIVYDRAGLGKNLPVIDITAEHTWVDAPDELAAKRRAHAKFVAASPSREGIFAKGSGHYVFKDQPNVVMDAILRMVSKVRERESTRKH
jgi:pimeloyl-ACP methyl ester carboxylesterase